MGSRFIDLEAYDVEAQVRTRHVRWCAPVLSSAVADEVASQIAKLHSEAAYERGRCDNFFTARLLDHDARVLEGRLVQPFWRCHAKAAIAAATV